MHDDVFRASSIWDKSEDEIIRHLTENGRDLRFAPDTIRQNKEAVLGAVSSHGQALHNASDDLKDDKEVVLAAVRKDGMALLAASDGLKADDEVVWAAVEQNKLAFALATPTFKMDVDNIDEARRLEVPPHLIPKEYDSPTDHAPGLREDRRAVRRTPGGVEPRRVRPRGEGSSPPPAQGSSTPPGQGSSSGASPTG